jgi:hypothetical protein
MSGSISLPAVRLTGLSKTLADFPAVAAVVLPGQVTVLLGADGPVKQRRCGCCSPGSGRRNRRVGEYSLGNRGWTGWAAELGDIARPGGSFPRLTSITHATLERRDDQGRFRSGLWASGLPAKAHDGVRTQAVIATASANFSDGV